MKVSWLNDRIIQFIAEHKFNIFRPEIEEPFSMDYTV